MRFVASNLDTSSSGRRSCVEIFFTPFFFFFLHRRRKQEARGLFLFMSIPKPHVRGTLTGLGWVFWGFFCIVRTKKVHVCTTSTYISLWYSCFSFYCLEIIEHNAAEQGSYQSRSLDGDSGCVPLLVQNLFRTSPPLF